MGYAAQQGELIPTKTGQIVRSAVSTFDGDDEVVVALLAAYIREMIEATPSMDASDLPEHIAQNLVANNLIISRGDVR